MALISERMEWCGKKVLDTAGVVRELLCEEEFEVVIMIALATEEMSLTALAFVLIIGKAERFQCGRQVGMLLGIGALGGLERRQASAGTYDVAPMETCD